MSFNENYDHRLLEKAKKTEKTRPGLTHDNAISLGAQCSSD